MVNPAYVAATVADAVEQVGKPCSLRRLTGSNHYFEVIVRAVVRGYHPDDMVEGIAAGDMQAILGNNEIAAAQWPGPPRKGDQLSVDGRTWTIQGNNNADVHGLMAMHRLQIRGSA
jgi:hypothetical protein